MSQQHDAPGSGPRSGLFSKGLVFTSLVFLAGIVFVAAFNAAMNFTNTTEFCTSCHSMKTNLVELQAKPHWKSKSGVHAGCADCHVPKDFTNKLIAKVMAAKDVYHELIGTINTPEKYEAHRLGMAKAVWAKMKASDSRECRSCHSFEHMATDLQDKFARRKHEKATERGETCIDCHQGVAHKVPKDPAASAEPDKPAAPATKNGT